MRERAATAFKQRIALDLNCNGKPTRAYPASALQIHGKAYRSANGDVLIAMNPHPKLNRCQGIPGDEWDSVWFHVQGDKFNWIGNGLTLLDTGDYTGEGTSEILFQYDGYNRDGYVLLDPRDDFEERIRVVLSLSARCLHQESRPGLRDHNHVAVGVAEPHLFDAPAFRIDFRFLDDLGFQRDDAPPRVEVVTSNQSRTPCPTAPRPR